MPKIGIVVNPNAGQNRRRRGIKNLLTRAVGHLGIVRVTRTIRDLAEVAREFYRKIRDTSPIFYAKK